jgi:hypothetical protein
VERRLLDRAPVLLGGHRADEHVVRTEELGQRRARRAAAVEIGAQCEHHDLVCTRIGRRLDDRRQERRALVLVGAEREHFLELIDHQHETLVRAEHAARRTQRAVLARKPFTDALGERRPQGTIELPQRVLAGAHLHDDPRLAVRENARLDRRNEPCADGRRLAAAGRPDDTEEGCAREPRDHLGDQALATIEPLGVAFAEAGEALVRRLLGLRRAAPRSGPEQPRLLADELQIDDACREVALHGAQVASSGGSLRREHAQTFRRLGVRPLADLLVHPARYAAARLQQAARQCVHRRSEIQRRDAADLVEAERLRTKRAFLARDAPDGREKLGRRVLFVERRDHERCRVVRA